MKTHPLASLFAVCLSCLCLSGLTFSPVAAVPSRAASVVPGRSIGHVRLASYHDRNFPAILGLGKPTAEDHAMGGRGSALWVAKVTRPGHRPDTLYIDTQGDGAGANPPTHRIRVLAVRVTSSFFRTRDGVGSGSTLSDIRRHYPQARREDTFTGTVDDDLLPSHSGPRHVVTPYTDRRHGIAFELPGAHPTGASRCTAVWVSQPGGVGPHG